MQYRQIGTSDLKTSVLSLGSYQTYSRMEYRDVVNLVRRAAELGINLFDVAHYRTAPHTEVVLARALRDAGLKRDQIMIMDKVWWYDNDEPTLEHQLDELLFRLDTDYLDVIMCYGMRPGRDDPAATARLNAGFVTSGKARAWGGLNWSAKDLRIAHETCVAEGLPTPQIVQLKYNIARRHIVESEEYTQLRAETGISIHASDSLEGGILAGSLVRERVLGRDPGNVREEIIGLVPKLREVAEGFGCSMAQLAIAFCIANPQTASLLFGASRIGQLEDNVGAVALVEKHGEAIVAALAGFGVAGHEFDLPPNHATPLTRD
ncbi:MULTISPECIES: aldo/keto reductase [Aminobacter]|uniref:Aryl-alcohol dehydrogenase-like predicted oxidoreductase n=1 Tax=Aminobacter aminovorans TaxID=83263 RepID=A0AAC8YUS5_AMIAI|nr:MULTISPECIES: aldo/keto reductase [Aminobacter]AMS44785.1 Voltage-gated potassium channel beta subunit [Aminobacter aminovorans]MBB3704421.1 aryl-alcohol dehydrogenase-like predicted oxidoreductase [Aminobacter aminovorans]WMD00603.1 aldo/keto reductase [Aminobacter niigataensis]